MVKWFYDDMCINNVRFTNSLNDESKIRSFRFMILYSYKNLDIVIPFLKDFLENPLFFICKDSVLVIFTNKERVDFKTIVDTISEDLGESIKLFEGFLITSERKKTFIPLLEIISECHFEPGYSKVSNLISFYRNKSKQLLIIKEALLVDLLKDNDFKSIVKGMFKNDLNVSKTAFDIYMHRNTLNNKLDYIESVTTLSLRRFNDAIAIYELFK